MKVIGFRKHTDKLEFVGRADSQVVTSVICNRSHPDPLGIVLWYANLEFAEGSQGVVQHCHSEPVRTLVWESPSNFGLFIVIHS